MGPELTTQEFTTAIYRIVNYKVWPKSLEAAQVMLRQHMAFMDYERDQGKPNGPVVWHGMMLVLGHLIQQRDQWRAKESLEPGYMFSPCTMFNRACPGMQGLNELSPETPTGATKGEPK